MQQLCRDYTSDHMLSLQDIIYYNSVVLHLAKASGGPRKYSYSSTVFK